MDDDMEFSEDPNVQELQSCSLIFDKLKVDYTKLAGSIELPLQVDEEKSVTLIQRGAEGRESLLASKKVKFLPPIQLQFNLPGGYPDSKPPTIKLSCSVLSQNTIREVEEQLLQIWQDYKDRVVFSLIDHLRERSQSCLDELLPHRIEVSDFDQYNDIVEFDLRTREKKFCSQTFDCEICQVGHKGSRCTQFDDCGHVFCNDCYIAQGEVDKVHCPEYTCTKNHITTRNNLMKMETWTLKDEGVREMVMKMFTPPVSTSKLRKLLTAESIQRYLSLFKKSQYEFIGKLLPSRLVECPRIGCDEVIFREDLNEKLVMCPKCKYAFCNDCRKSYHARFKACVRVGDDNGKYGGIAIDDLEAYNHMAQGSHEKKILNAKYGRNKILKAVDEYTMDKLFEQMLKQGTDLKECPGCGAVIEKFEGCNKMKCSECLTCFCFNCGTQTDNSYDHFTDPQSPCYKLLFFGMPGVEDD
ncbi:hypothetical protein KGF57_005066 [Candida theae]|uniref:RBR-type E3 ubiquitin transferase n=1 Tax=Candida theae TaxID=1198502 RepID=A0AAD5FWK2_9ASCO|nr:uncharacterized protein KGF57_005066 [Candida theae]KAI5949003.1 hypothetical protein KGF57_005066 [Candida theae]